MYRYTVLLYTTCTDELYFCVNNSYKRDNHTHTNIVLYINIFMYRYYCTQLEYMDGISEVNICTLLYNLTLPTNTCGAHIMLGSVVLLYVYTVVQSLYACTVNLF